MRICKTCLQEKPLSEFYFSRCKPCVSEETKARYQTSDGKAKSLASLRKRRYGVSVEEVFNKQKEQDNACAICHATFTRTPHVDHNHLTGKVRGLLCGSCNTACGKLLHI